MRISAEVNDGVVQTKIPCIQYDQSMKEYDSELIMLASTVMSACAETIGKEDIDMTMMALDSIYNCAKVCAKQSVKVKFQREDYEE